MVRGRKTKTITPPHSQRSEIEFPEEHRVKRLVLGNGVVHDSHESWLLRERGVIFLWEVWRMGHVSTRTADQGLQGPANNVTELKRLSRGLVPTVERNGLAVILRESFPKIALTQMSPTNPNIDVFFFSIFHHTSHVCFLVLIFLVSRFFLVSHGFPHSPVGMTMHWL